MLDEADRLLDMGFEARLVLVDWLQCDWLQCVCVCVYMYDDDDELMLNVLRCHLTY